MIIPTLVYVLVKNRMLLSSICQNLILRHGAYVYFWFHSLWRTIWEMCCANIFAEAHNKYLHDYKDKGNGIAYFTNMSTSTASIQSPDFLHQWHRPYWLFSLPQLSFWILLVNQSTIWPQPAKWSWCSVCLQPVISVVWILLTRS